MEVITSIEDLRTYLSNDKDTNVIVVEGYDGVGKGRVLNILQEEYKVKPYRPDYNFWQSYDLKKKDRWKIAGFFWDIFSSTCKLDTSSKILFDRGVISGAVYAKDRSIAENYKYLLRDMLPNVLHILVVCTREDFEEFYKLRNGKRRPISTAEINRVYEEYLRFTDEFIDCLNIAGVRYIMYENIYAKSFASKISDKCESCGHYSYGYCMHPDIRKEVHPEGLRCSKSNDKEVQDIDTEM